MKIAVQCHNNEDLIQILRILDRNLDIKVQSHGSNDPVRITEVVPETDENDNLTGIILQ